MIFQSVEFYVMAAVVAAAVVAVSARGEARGPVRQILLPGVITEEGDGHSPGVELICGEDGIVLLRRHGMAGVRASGAVSLAIEVKGFDVRIQERVVEGSSGDACVDTASFLLDFMGRERYFISYRSELTSSSQSLFAAFTLHNRPGNHISRPLQ